METEINQVQEPFSARQRLRSMSDGEWILAHGSGTLRKNKNLGFVWRPQYLHERVAWDFGHGFEILPRSRVTFGDAISEGDCKPVTEAGWFIDRYFTINKAVFPTDHYECKYLHISDKEGDREGIGIVVRTTCAPWLPSGHLVFAIVAEYIPGMGVFRDAQNPL